MCMVIAAFRLARTKFLLSQLCSCNNGNGCDAAAVAAAAQWARMLPPRMLGPMMSCVVTIAHPTPLCSALWVTLLMGQSMFKRRMAGWLCCEIAAKRWQTAGATVWNFAGASDRTILLSNSPFACYSRILFGLSQRWPVQWAWLL